MKLPGKFEPIRDVDNPLALIHLRNFIRRNLIPGVLLVLGGYLIFAPSPSEEIEYSATVKNPEVSVFLKAVLNDEMGVFEGTENGKTFTSFWDLEDHYHITTIKSAVAGAVGFTDNRLLLPVVDGHKSSRFLPSELSPSTETIKLVEYSFESRTFRIREELPGRPLAWSDGCEYVACLTESRFLLNDGYDRYRYLSVLNTSTGEIEEIMHTPTKEQFVGDWLYFESESRVYVYNCRKKSLKKLSVPNSKYPLFDWAADEDGIRVIQNEIGYESDTCLMGELDRYAGIVRSCFRGIPATPITAQLRSAAAADVFEGFGINESETYIDWCVTEFTPDGEVRNIRRLPLNSIVENPAGLQPFAMLDTRLACTARLYPTGGLSMLFVDLQTGMIAGEFDNSASPGIMDDWVFKLMPGGNIDLHETGTWNWRPLSDFVVASIE